MSRKYFTASPQSTPSSYTRASTSGTTWHRVHTTWRPHFLADDPYRLVQARPFGPRKRDLTGRRTTFWTWLKAYSVNSLCFVYMAVCVFLLNLYSLLWPVQAGRTNTSNMLFETLAVHCKTLHAYAASASHTYPAECTKPTHLQQFGSHQLPVALRHVHASFTSDAIHPLLTAIPAEPSYFIMRK